MSERWREISVLVDPRPSSLLTWCVHTTSHWNSVSRTWFRLVLVSYPMTGSWNNWSSTIAILSNDVESSTRKRQLECWPQRLHLWSKFPRSIIHPLRHNRLRNQRQPNTPPFRTRKARICHRSILPVPRLRRRQADALLPVLTPFMSFRSKCHRRSLRRKK